MNKKDKQEFYLMLSGWSMERYKEIGGYYYTIYIPPENSTYRKRYRWTTFLDNAYRAQKRADLKQRTKV